ncbi:MAG: hypothetical protein L6R40_003537 [Gallowayella cf. fulva]|nr:MAG: hypothetical protein L6R40_003537 [Xanthomendoza cf. fulva]
MRAVTHSPNLISAGEALRRVFLPNWRIQSTFLWKRKTLGHQLLSLRHRSYGRPGNSEPTAAASNHGPVRDEGISASEVQVVASDNSLRPPTSLRAILASIDRQAQFLIQVGEKVHPRFDDAPPLDEGETDNRPTIPVCKIVDKSSHLQAEFAKAKTKKNTAVLTKEIELNWNIATHDLDHRLKRMRQFLNEGRRVEVVFGKKRKGWMRKKAVEDSRADEVVGLVRSNAGRVEGTKEWKAMEWKTMEGEVPPELRMFFEAKRSRQRGEGAPTPKNEQSTVQGQKMANGGNPQDR